MAESHDPAARGSSFTEASQLLARAAAAGFDWERPCSILAKLEEEVAELRRELGPNPNHARLVDEFGDVLLVMVNLARHLEIDPDRSLQHATRKFARRFEFIEKSLADRGKTMSDSNLAEMESLWQLAKLQERSDV